MSCLLSCLSCLSPVSFFRRFFGKIKRALFDVKETWGDRRHETRDTRQELFDFCGGDTFFGGQKEMIISRSHQKKKKKMFICFFLFPFPLRQKKNKIIFFQHFSLLRKKGDIASLTNSTKKKNNCCPQKNELQGSVPRACRRQTHADSGRIRVETTLQDVRGGLLQHRGTHDDASTL